DDVGDVHLFGEGAGGRVDEQQVLAEGDAPEVLHRPSREVGQSEQVDLVARIRDAVVALEPVEGEGADLRGERGEMALAGHVHDAQRYARRVDRLGDLEG